jgi:hypothetical protein
MAWERGMARIVEDESLVHHDRPQLSAPCEFLCQIRSASIPQLASWMRSLQCIAQCVVVTVGQKSKHPL